MLHVYPLLIHKHIEKTMKKIVCIDRKYVSPNSQQMATEHTELNLKTQESYSD